MLYEAEAAARDAGNLQAYGSSATVGIVYGSMLDQSRISIANACLTEATLLPSPRVPALVDTACGTISGLD